MQVGWFLIVAFFIGCFAVYLIAKPDEMFLYPKNNTTTNSEYIKGFYTGVHTGRREALKEKYSANDIRRWHNMPAKDSKAIESLRNEIYEYINQTKKEAEIISRQNIQKYKENNGEGIYKIKVWYNAAETWRDPDDICVSLEKYFSKIDSALDFMTNYVEQKFKNAGCFHIEGNALICSDYCSWGRTIELKKIEVMQ